VRWLVGNYSSSFPQHSATPALKYLLRLGLVIGDYNNNWQLDLPADERLAARLMAAGMQRVRSDAASIAGKVYSAGQAGVPLTNERLQQLASLVLESLSLDNWQGWLGTTLGAPNGAPLSRGETYQFAEKFLRLVSKR
jgi:hypothetical protein